MGNGHAMRAGGACAVLVLAIAACGFADQPAPRPPGKPKRPALDQALAELRKEFTARAKDPDAPARTECNYFTEHPTDATPEQVVAALERQPPRGEDPRVTAYVRWQLLSAAPETFDEKLAPKVLAAYRKAPPPAPRFGMSERDRGRLDKLLADARPQDDVVLNENLKATQNRVDAANAPLLAYRDELYRRLPGGVDKFRAGLRDAHERMLAGAAQQDHMTRLVEDVQAWTLSGDGSAKDYAELAELVGRLRFEKSPPYYSKASVRRGKLAWTNATDELYSPKKLADLQALLMQAAKSANGDKR